MKYFPTLLRPLSACLLLALLAAATPAQAVDYSWQSAGNGNWSDAANWSPASPAGPPDGAGDSFVTPTAFGSLRYDVDAPTVFDWTYDASSSLTTLALNGGTPVTLTILNNLTKSGSGNLTFRNSGGSAQQLTVDVQGEVIVNEGELQFGVLGGTNYIEAFQADSATVNGGVLNLRVGETAGTATIEGALTLTGNGQVFLRDSSGSGTLAVGSLVSASSSAEVTVNNFGSTAATGLLQLNNGSGSADYAGVLSDGTSANPPGTLNVEKNNAGSQELSGADNEYSGTTTVNGGTLLVSGRHDGGGEYIVNSGGTLAGDNGGNLEATANIVTANDAGITLNDGAMLAMGSTLDETGIFSAALDGGVMDISGAVGGANTGALVFDLAAIGSSDQFLLLSGSLEIGNGELEFVDFAFTALAGIEEGDYVLFDTSEAITGSLGSNLTGQFGLWEGTLGFADGGNDLVLSVVLVPEPSTGALLLGLGLLVLRRRRS
ncbi:MAG: autotransporter-associated beta strand repeat-containing protein [Verrucomicrobiota bacterium]